MGGVFSKPKAPKIEPPKPVPVPDDALGEAEQRKRMARMLKSQGRAANMRVGEDYQNRGIGA